MNYIPIFTIIAFIWETKHTQTFRITYPIYSDKSSIRNKYKILVVGKEKRTVVLTNHSETTDD